MHILTQPDSIMRRLLRRREYDILDRIRLGDHWRHQAHRTAHERTAAA